jgi:DNA primase
MPKRDWRDVKEIKEHVDLTAIWGDTKIKCPWHNDSSPSLQIYPDHVHCFSAGCPSPTHDGIDLVMKLQNLNFDQAVDWLIRYRDEKVVKPEPIDTRPIPDDIAIIHASRIDEDEPNDYLRYRGISPEIARDVKLGWTGRAITIPHIVGDQAGHWLIDNIKFRPHPDYLMDGEPKYTAYKGHMYTRPYPWYFYQKTYGDSPICYVTEGELDALVLLSHKVPALSIPTGAGTDLLQWNAFWRSLSQLIFIFDMDSGGDSARSDLLTPSKITGLSKADTMAPNTHILTWDPEQGKDITDAQDYLLPIILEDYRRRLHTVDNVQPRNRETT